MALIRLFSIAMVMLTASIPASAHEQHLEGTEWGGVGDAGEAARYISFAGSGRVFGFGGCNRVSGSYEQHDGHLAIAALATTGMACAADAMAKEREFLDMLAKVRGRACRSHAAAVPRPSGRGSQGTDTARYRPNGIGGRMTSIAAPPPGFNWCPGLFSSRAGD